MSRPLLWQIGTVLTFAGIGCLLVVGWPWTGTVLCLFGMACIWRAEAR